MKHLLLLFLLLPFYSLSQKVIFCEDVDHLGLPKNPSTQFTVTSKGGFFKILVKLNKEVESRSIVFDVYRLEEKKELLESSLRMDIQPAVTWFYKEITFFKEGEYHVYVYDERDKLLGVGKVQIISK